MTQNQRSYYAFLRAVKSRFDVSHEHAIAAYKAYKRDGGQPRGNSVVRHPRLTARALERGTRSLAREKRNRDRERAGAAMERERKERERERANDEARFARLISRYEERKKIGRDGRIYIRKGRFGEPGAEMEDEPELYVLAIDYVKRKK